MPERLIIAYAALTAFADPSVQFGLQFRVAPNADAPVRSGVTTPTPIGNAADGDAPAGDGTAADGEAERKTGYVVALDAFRKKKT